MVTLKRRRGFTLIELMVTLSIFGLLLALAIPNWRHHLAQRNLDGTFRQVAGLLKLAREQATSTGTSTSAGASGVAGVIQVSFENTTNSTVVCNVVDLVNANNTIQHFESQPGVFVLYGAAGAPALLATGVTKTAVFWATGAYDDAANPGTGLIDASGNATAAIPDVDIQFQGSPGSQGTPTAIIHPVLGSIQLAPNFPSLIQ